MVRLLFAANISDAYALANNLVLEQGMDKPSERGPTKFLPNILVVVNHPERDQSIKESAPPVAIYSENPNESWVIASEDNTGETYEDRMKQPLDQTEIGVKLISEYPYSRRFSYVIARPWDILSGTPPALMEIYVQITSAQKDDETISEVHVTGFYRSVDTNNYLKINLTGLAEVQARISMETGFQPGTIAMMMANAHYYERDEREVEKIGIADQDEPNNHAVLIESEHIPFGWRQTLEHVYYRGFEDKTQWGEVFEKQAKAKFGHRVLIDISEPLEDMLDDKAPFSREYGEEYAMRYIMGSLKDTPVKQDDIMLEENEVYTYASRARWDRNDIQQFKREPVDQIYHAIKLLRENKHTRKAAVNISRPWDLTLREPACLRAYVLQTLDDETLGMTLFMRSNDAYGATHANQYGFARLAEFVANHTGFERVHLTLLSANMHIYGDSWEEMERMMHPEMPSARERLGL